MVMVSNIPLLYVGYQTFKWTQENNLIMLFIYGFAMSLIFIALGLLFIFGWGNIGFCPQWNNHLKTNNDIIELKKFCYLLTFIINLIPLISMKMAYENESEKLDIFCRKI